MRFLYFLAHITLDPIFSAYFRWRVFNPERVPASGAVILAANHASLLDPPLIGSALPREICFLARESLFRFPLINLILYGVNAMPVDREGGNPAGLKRLLYRLSCQDAVVLFPEGTRTPDGCLQRARSGIGLTVVKSGAPVVPVRLFGAFEAFGRHARIPRPRQILVKFGHPLRFEALVREFRSSPKARQREIYQQIADDIMRAIAELQPWGERSTFP